MLHCQGMSVQRIERFGAIAVATLAIGIAGASEARADLVYLSSGRTLSVKSVHMSGSEVTLSLRGGGDMTFDRDLIARVEPDEVPYPEPPAPGDAQAAVPVAP